MHGGPVNCNLLVKVGDDATFPFIIWRNAFGDEPETTINWETISLAMVFLTLRY